MTEILFILYFEHAYEYLSKLPRAYLVYRKEHIDRLNCAFFQFQNEILYECLMQTCQTQAHRPDLACDVVRPGLQGCPGNGKGPASAASAPAHPSLAGRSPWALIGGGAQQQLQFICLAQLISPNPAWPCPTPPGLASSHLASPRLITSGLSFPRPASRHTQPLLASPGFTLSHPASPLLTWPHFASSHPASPRHTRFLLITPQPCLISPHLVTPGLSSPSPALPSLAISRLASPLLARPLFVTSDLSSPCPAFPHLNLPPSASPCPASPLLVLPCLIP